MATAAASSPVWCHLQVAPDDRPGSAPGDFRHVDLPARLPELPCLFLHSGLGELADVVGNLHGTEARPAHGAEVAPLLDSRAPGSGARHGATTSEAPPRQPAALWRRPGNVAVAAAADCALPRPAMNATDIETPGKARMKHAPHAPVDLSVSASGSEVGNGATTVSAGGTPQWRRRSPRPSSVSPGPSDVWSYAAMQRI